MCVFVCVCVCVYCYTAIHGLAYVNSHVQDCSVKFIHPSVCVCVCVCVFVYILVHLSWDYN